LKVAVAKLQNRTRSTQVNKVNKRDEKGSEDKKKIKKTLMERLKGSAGLVSSLGKVVT